MAKDNESFDDVFARDGSEMGADPAAPVTDAPPRDDAGRFAPKQETPPPVEKPVETLATPTPEAPPADTDAKRHVPLSELLSERDKRKSEAKLREEAEKRYEATQAQLAEIQRQFQAQQQPQYQAPDPWVDPAAALQHQQEKFDFQLKNINANNSQRWAVEKFGVEKVQEAAQAAIRAGAADYFFNRPDPFADLMQWHRQQTFISKVGADPDAYEKSIEQRAYERALADLRAGKVPLPGQPQTAQPTQRFPGSLADATQSGTQSAVLTDEAIAAELFAPNRNRRAM